MTNLSDVATHLYPDTFTGKGTAYIINHLPARHLVRLMEIMQYMQALEREAFPPWTA